MLLTSVLMVSVIAADCAAAEFSVQQLIELLAASEPDTGVIEYSVESTSGTLEDALSPRSIISLNPIGAVSAFVRLDLSRQRYFIEQTFVSDQISYGRNSAEIKSHLASRMQFSNDRETFRMWRRYRTGDVIPAATDEDATCIGVICASADEVIHVQNEGFMKVWAPMLGINWMPPAFCPMFQRPLPLSQFVKERMAAGEDVRVHQIDDRYAELIVATDKTAEMTPSKAAYDLYSKIDLKIGRPVLAEWIQLYHLTDGISPVFKRVFIDYSQVDNVTFPVECTLVETRGAPLFQRWTFRDIKRNDSAAADAFRLAFPKGTQLTDHVEKKYYVTGTGAADDAKAIAAFAERYVSRRVERTLLQRSNVGIWSVVVGSLAILLLVCFWTFRHHRRTRRMGIVLLAVSINMNSACGAEVRVQWSYNRTAPARPLQLAWPHYPRTHDAQKFPCSRAAILG